MFSKSIQILNFDDSLTGQLRLISQYKPVITDLKDLGPLARLWMGNKLRQDIEKRIQGLAKESITFLGSGDFHHLSHVLIKRFTEPLTVIVFDFHPDWDILPPRLGCGSWLTQTLKKENILKFFLIGVSSSDISSWKVQSGNLDSLKGDRVEIYPYAHRPSLVFFRKIPENISLVFKEKFFYKKIYWNEIKGKNLQEFFPSLLKRVPTKKVYVSIDKDCLKNEYSLTNWEEGLFSLEEMLLMLKIIRDNFDIAGLDIVGDYSPSFIKGRLKRMLSFFDHPKKIRAARLPGYLTTAINEETNLKILELLNS